VCDSEWRSVVIENPIEIIKENGEIVYLVDGWAVDDDPNPNPRVVKFGLLKQDLKKYIDRSMMSSFAQFDQLIVNGLIMTRHIFQGLNRPLYDDQSLSADKNKLIHTWRPSWDYEWRGGRSGASHRLRAPENSVFVAIISKNTKHLDKFPSVYGWIDWWNWLQEDGFLPEAPLNWFNRYDKKLYTRNGG
jgi:hypothetical protein